MKKFITAVLLLCAVSFAASSAANATPLRVGPVSAYGALGTNGNKVVGSNGKQVMLRGMSLFWSDATGSGYYNENVIAWAAKSLGIDVFRFAMGIGYYNSQGSASEPLLSSYSYLENPEGRESSLDVMVKAAIENDIYIIIDWHSHRAESEQARAVDFFTRMAQKYASVPNIIWEVYNEPVNTSASTIANYANAVISGIRKYSSNLALVGTPNWSQMPGGSCGGVRQTNVGYVFHFYAGSHSLNSYRGNIESCRNGGNAVFITEWGTTSANGSGNVNTSESSNWTNYMEQNRISNCNWSLRHATIGGETEASAMFSGSSVLNTESALNSASYTTSGNFVKNYLTSHKSSWADTITAGARNGACAFAHTTVSELDGSKSGVAKSSCSYTSSNPSVATVNNGVINIVGTGYTIMQGNDGTKSVVTVTPMPAQNVPGLKSYSIPFNKVASTSSKYSSTNAGYEFQVTTSAKTVEGATISCSSDNASVASVVKATCTTTSCYTNKGNQQCIATLTGAVGVANVHLTAPAISGFRALDTTVTITVEKAVNTLNTRYFKDQTVALGSVTQVFTLIAHDVPVTYTIFPEGYATQDGENLIAGDKDMTLTITASAPETDTYKPVNSTITVVVGAGGAQPAPPEAIVLGRLASVSRNALIDGNMLHLNVVKSGFVKVQVFNAQGQNAVRNIVRYMNAGAHSIDLSSINAGQYFVRISQMSSSETISWSKK